MSRSLSRRVLASVVAVAGFAAFDLVAAPAALAAPPVNDDPAGAIALTVPSSLTLDTTEATTSAEETALNDFCGAPAFEQAVWFTATPTANISAGIDVTASDYTAGILVLAGEPGAFTPVTCGPGVVSGPVTAGTTYHIVIFGDGVGPATSGNLVVETFVAPPPPVVTVTVDGVGSVDRAGAATLTGTASCTSDDPNASLVDLSLELRQNVGRFTIRGFSFAELFTPCDGQAQRWTATVVGDTGKFAGGKATLATFAFACDRFTCSVAEGQAAVSLRRGR